MKDFKQVFSANFDTDTSYIVGKARNEDIEGDGTGSPWHQIVINDLMMGPVSALFNHSDIVADNSDEKAGQSQWVDALKTLAQDMNYGENFKGSFAKGFTYTSAEDVGRGQDGEYYEYIGSDPFPKSIPAGLDPSTVPSDYVASGNLKTEFDTVDEAVNYKKIVKLLGKRVYIAERDAYFNVVLSSTFSGDGEGMDELTSYANSIYGYILDIRTTMHVTAFGVKFGGANADDIFSRIYQLDTVKNIDCTPPDAEPINVENLDIPTNKTIFSSGNSTPTFKTSGVSCFSSASFTALTNVGTTIKDMMILGTAGVTQLLVDAYRLRRFRLSNVRLRDIDQTAIAYRDFAGNDNKYEDVFVEGRVVYTGTAGSELGSNVKTTNLSMINIGIDKALEIRNHVNPSFNGIYQNSDGSSADMIGIYLSEQCEGVHLNDIQQVRYGVGVRVDTGLVGVAPLATKITNSIFDQYVSAAIVCESARDIQDINNTFSYQLDTASAQPSVQVGGGCSKYKQATPTFIENQKEAVVIRAASKGTTISTVTVSNGAKSGNFADIRAEGGASYLIIDGVNSDSYNNTCVELSTGSGSDIRVRNVIAENAAIVDILNNATGNNVITDADNLKTRSYNFANLPSAPDSDYEIVTVEDRSRVTAYSDGSVWRYVSDNSLVT